jgi:hypothetical protein
VTTEVENYPALAGRTIKRIDGLVGGVEVIITLDIGKVLIYHSQDCCESVELLDFDGYPNDLVGATIKEVEQVSSQGRREDGDSETWTFIKIETDKGGLWMRWYGSSNGYYSEEVTVHYDTEVKE